MTDTIIDSQFIQGSYSNRNRSNKKVLVNNFFSVKLIETLSN